MYNFTDQILSSSSTHTNYNVTMTSLYTITRIVVFVAVCYIGVMHGNKEENSLSIVHTDESDEDSKGTTICN